MNITCRIIGTDSQLIEQLTVTVDVWDPPALKRVEAAARDWVAQHNMRYISDIFSQGEFRAWVEPRDTA